MKLTPEESGLIAPFCTARQREVLSAVLEAGSVRGASRALGCSQKNVQVVLAAARAKGAAREPALHSPIAPATYPLRGVSTQVDASGNVISRWIKTQQARGGISPERFIEIFKEALEAEPLPKAPRLRLEKPCDADLMTCYPMGDPHFGLLAWGQESGADFDLKIAERNLCDTTQHLVELSPRSERALIIGLGDGTHADSSAGTTTGGTRVDADSRFGKVIRVLLRSMIRCIETALRKHGSVHVIIEIGNHDTHTSAMIALALEARYTDNDRVFIDTSPSPYHWYEFGKNLIGVTHGHGPKIKDLPLIMAQDQAEACGRTKHRYWRVGHFHHQAVHEFQNCVVETFNTLAPKDAWHNLKGYRSRRVMVADVHHKNDGIIIRYSKGVTE